MSESFFTETVLCIAQFLRGIVDCEYYGRRFMPAAAAEVTVAYGIFF